MGQVKFTIHDLIKEFEKQTPSRGSYNHDEADEQVSYVIKKWYTLTPRSEEDPLADGDVTGDLLLQFELVSEHSEKRNLPLFFKWFPEVPHSDTIISGTITKYH